MDSSNTGDDKNVLLRIQNQQNPEQIIDLLWDKPRGYFVTNGLKELFGIQEIRIDSKDLLASLDEYAHVLSFLLETMSTSEDIHLPYGYEEIFEFGGNKYTLYTDKEHRVLKRATETSGKEDAWGHPKTPP